MKTVGKQLQEARLAKNWSPELAARETKIRVDRLHDLENDDYTHFSSPTYARGFVRTYARSLGLDEYKILRQLDNKLPEEDHSTLVSDSGVTYVPEPAKPKRKAGSMTGVYVVLALGAAVVFVIVFVLFQAYRTNELQGYFANANTPETYPLATNAPSTNAESSEPARAIPVEPNALGTNVATNPATPENGGPGAPPRAAPVDPNDLTSAPVTTPPGTVRALPVDPGSVSTAPVTTAPPPATVTPPPTVAVTATTAVATVGVLSPATATNVSNNPQPPNGKAPPRALPVDPNDLPPQAATTGTPPAVVAAVTSTNTVIPTAPPATPPTPAPPPVSARASNSGPVHLPPAPDTVPAVAPPATAPATQEAQAAPVDEGAFANTAGKRLVFTASKDSFIRVTTLDGTSPQRVIYSSVLRTGQSIGFDGRRFSVSVTNPSAIAITLDGVNYGPHSDQESPDTFTLESHQP